MNTETCNRLSSVRVLLVEDVRSLRRAVRLMLEMEGAEVTEASTASEAVSLVATPGLDVVLTDLGLPDRCGEAVVAAIRVASRGGVPIVVLSGAAEPDLARALRAGAEHAIRKPVDAEVLVRYLARHAGHTRGLCPAGSTRRALSGRR